MDIWKTETDMVAVSKSHAHKATKPWKRKALCPLSAHLQKDSLTTKQKYHTKGVTTLTAHVKTPAFINPYFCLFVRIMEISIKVEDLHKIVSRNACVGITSPATSQ